MERIECLAICHSYDGHRDAVSNLSLTIRAGEVMALIGPNGAGKSTTLRILATLQRPDRGHVEWDGRSAWDDRYGLRRRIGFLGDGTALYPNMTAQSYLHFFAECYGYDSKASKQRADEVLARFDLTSKAESRISDLSKGMRQRLAIARTLVHEPELLLLDEPADGLDPLARRQLREVLRATASRGVGIVVSSHILRELDGFVDSVALIQRGRLEVCGTVETVIADYEVGRRLHEIQITRGFSRAVAILQQHEGLIEAIEPLHKGDEKPDPAVAECGLIRVRIRGAEDRAALLLRELVLADIEVIAFSKVRSDLEDVYQSMGRDEVS